MLFWQPYSIHSRERLGACERQVGSGPPNEQIKRGELKESGKGMRQSQNRIKSCKKIKNKVGPDGVKDIEQSVPEVLMSP